MKKKYYLLTVITIGTFSFIAYYLGCAEKLKEADHQNKVETKQTAINERSSDKEVIPSNWKTYTNEHLGFSFQHPHSWVKNEKDIESTDRFGKPTSVEIIFTDTLFETSFLISYHFAPKGVELYKYAVSQFDSSKGERKMTIAGNNAIQKFTTIKKDGKGHPLNPPFKLIIVDFLDNQQTGGIELQFKTAIPDDKETSKFEQLLSTFKFLN